MENMYSISLKILQHQNENQLLYFDHQDVKFPLFMPSLHQQDMLVLCFY